MRKIFAYTDYREFLKDFYTYKKSNNSHYSYRLFAQKAGIKSPSLFKEIAEGKRNLSPAMCEKFIKALALSENEGRFFSLLVRFNQAKTDSEKREHYASIVSMVNNVKVKDIAPSDYDYYSEWYHSAIRELITLVPSKTSNAKIGKMLIPKIKADQVAKSIELLLKLGFIRKNIDGSYSQEDKHITNSTDNLDLNRIIRREFNSKIIELSKLANENISPDSRNVSSLTVGISKAGYDAIVQEIEFFKNRVISIVNSDTDSDSVYQISTQLFPLSNRIEKKGLDDV